jgi:hypothetical protein
MLKSMLSTRLQVSLAIAAAAIATGVTGVTSLNAAPASQASQNTVIAYENMCEEDELVAGDEVSIGDDSYVLEEDENGLFIEYVLVDAETGEQVSEEVGTYSLTEFGEDCETVSFQQVDGVDSLVGEDVD